MIKKIPLLLVTSVLLVACGGGSSSGTSDDNVSADNTLSETPTSADINTDNDTGTGVAASPEIGSMDFICTANAASETAFNDTFVESRFNDHVWPSPAITDPTSVEQIANAFNSARSLDPTIQQKLLMPQQADWDAMTSSEKGLFLVNSERCARGLEPFEGIAPELIDSTSGYANELSDSGEFSHSFGLYASPTERLTGYAGVVVRTNADFMAQTENLARHTSGNTGAHPTINEPVARAIYAYMYEDSSSAYGHRTLILIKVDNENSGGSGAEGLFGLSKTSKQFFDAPFFKTEVTSVMHVFDPNDSWDMSNVLAAPAIFGPETQTDCLSAVFVESVDSVGNNTSSCQ